MAKEKVVDLRLVACDVAEEAAAIMDEWELGRNPLCEPAIPEARNDYDALLNMVHLTDDALRVLRTSRYTEHLRERPDAAQCGSATSGVSA